MSQVPFPVPGVMYPGDPNMQQPVYPYPPAQQPPVTQPVATSFGGHVQAPPQPAPQQEMSPIDTLMKVILPRLVEKSKAHDEAIAQLSANISSLAGFVEDLRTQATDADTTALAQEVAALKEQIEALTAATAKKPRAPRKKKAEVAEEQPAPVETVTETEEDAPMYMGADGNMYVNRELAPGLRIYPDDDYLSNPLLVDGQPIDAAFIRKVQETYAKTNGLHGIEAMADIYDLNEAALKFYHTMPTMTRDRILSLGQ